MYWVGEFILHFNHYHFYMFTGPALKRSGLSRDPPKCNVAAKVHAMHLGPKTSGVELVFLLA